MKGIYQTKLEMNHMIFTIWKLIINQSLRQINKDHKTKKHVKERKFLTIDVLSLFFDSSFPPIKPEAHFKKLEFQLLPYNKSIKRHQYDS